ncbi:MAG: SDR family NAD(P)-dependent oxidoreductase [Desulfovibrionaceae bacterium]
MPHIVLTGASGGLGRALAVTYAGPGVRLHLTGRDAARLAAVAETCRARGAAVATTVLDLATPGAAAAFARDTDANRPVDVALACAGLSSSVRGDGGGETPEAVERVFAVNTLAVAGLLGPLAEAMRRRGRGALAVIGSLAGLRGQPSSPAYSASKAGALAYGEGLRAWLAPYGVTVTVVAPGFVETPMSRRYRGAKPLLWPADRAAAAIVAAVAAGRPRLEFPGPLALGSRLLGLLPPRIGDAVLRRFFAFTVDPVPGEGRIAPPEETR